MKLYRIYTNLEKQFLKRWWAAVAVGALLITIAGLFAIFLPRLVRLIINKKLAIVEGGFTYAWWKNPPVTPQFHVYVYNVTNPYQFLKNQKKPAIKELGPYVYLETWKKVNVEFHPNGTVTYKLNKKFIFSKELSAGLEEDLVVVPNIPMLTTTSQAKHSIRSIKLAINSLIRLLRIKPFIEVSVGQLLWGYDDPLIRFTKDILPSEAAYPHERFGLLHGKNGTSSDSFAMFTGSAGIHKYGLLDKWNGKTRQGHWTTPQCDGVTGSDGSIFPPQISKDSWLKIFEKDLCRTMPLVFQQEVASSAGVPAFRFVPHVDAFSSADRVHSQECYCPGGPPCAPEGTFNASFCQHGAPILLSFPHFYLAKPELREAVTGVSPPESEKHQLYIDVEPTVGMALKARYRLQINLAVSRVPDIKQVASFPDIVFPIMWFEDRVDDLPEEITSVLRMVVELPPIANVVLSAILAVIGFIILIGALICLMRAANHQDKLHLNHPQAANPKSNDTLAPIFQNLSVKSLDAFLAAVPAEQPKSAI